MLFSNLHALLKSGVTLNLILASVGDDKVEVTVLPNSEKSTAGTQLVAKTFVATPQELDAQFPEVMAGYASTNLSLKEQLEAMQMQAEAAAEAAKAEAAKKSEAKSGAKTITKNSSATKPSLLDEVESELSCEGENSSGNQAPDSTSGGPATVDLNQTQIISL